MPCCSTTSSPTATAAPRPHTLQCLPYDVARGSYVIASAKADPELKHAIDTALAAMRKDGGSSASFARRSCVITHFSHCAAGGPAGRPLASSTATWWCSSWSLTWVDPQSHRCGRSCSPRAIGIGLAVAGSTAPDRFARRRDCTSSCFPRNAGAAPAVRPVLRRGFRVVNSAQSRTRCSGLGLNYGAYERGSIAAAARDPSRQSRASRALCSGPRRPCVHDTFAPALRLALPR